MCVARSSMRPSIVLSSFALLASLALALMLGVETVSSLPGSGGVVPKPVLSPVFDLSERSSDNDSLLLGATSAEKGEAWALRKQRTWTPIATINGTPLEYAQTTGSDPQSVFYRYKSSTGWQAVDTPRDAAGEPIQALVPIHESAAMTGAGGGALLSLSPAAAALVIMDPGGSFEANLPPNDVLYPANVDGPAERLSTSNGDRGPLSAFDTAEGTGVFAAAIGRPQETVLRFDGDAWSRETVDYPTDWDTDFNILAISAVSKDVAWMAARSADAPDRGLVLFGRDTDGVWRERSLGSSKFAASESPADGATEIKLFPLAQPAIGSDPLTATEDGVWLDGTMIVDGAQRTFTVFYDIASASITGSWCDAVGTAGAICERALGGELSRVGGYRSTAWAGPGFGKRVITNPVDDNVDSVNDGTYLQLSGSDFLRMPAAGYDAHVGSALFSEDSGWIGPSTLLTDEPTPNRLASWSVGTRSPLLDVTPEPNKPTASLDSAALTVGEDGSVARYTPGNGWNTEYLQTANGLVTRPDLRAVAWPEPSRAHAVGDEGAMWLWRAENKLWQRDPGTPVGFESHLMDIAFDPANSNRGYAVGRDGVILQYGKSWERVCASPGAFADCGSATLPGALSDETFRSIAFAGSQALAVSRRELLVSNGGDWVVDEQFKAVAGPLFAKVGAADPDAELVTVTGLPDGGAFVGGDFGLAFKRESAGAPWTTVAQPLPELTITSASLFRDNGKLRATVAVASSARFPETEVIPAVPPNQPPPYLLPLTQPGEGFLLRETADGWRDETNSAYGSPTRVHDKPTKPDPVRGILLDSGGNGWVVGGINGRTDMIGRGTSVPDVRQRVRTASIQRYEAGGSASSGAGAPIASQVAQPQGGVGFLVGGHASCDSRRCSTQTHGGIGPDRNLAAALDLGANMSTQQNGPRFFVYTGGRLPVAGSARMPLRETQRLASILASNGFPVFGAVSEADSVGSDVSSHTSAYAGFGAPFGSGPAAPGIVPRGSASSARTHYAFDSTGPSGRIRVVVIDNSRGSLAASDPHQNPPVASQEQWLIAELQSAKSEGTPAVVVGSRDLNESFSPKLNIATDGNHIARLLVREGASAYFFERPEENRQFRIPAGEADSIPAFGTGTLGYRPDPDAVSTTTPSLFFGNNGTLLANVDVANRDPSTNRAPVTVRMIPLLENLNIDAVDGTELRRSRPALFTGLGRRPLAGDRWGTTNDPPSPGGSDPYTVFPLELCQIAGCDTRIGPEFQFHSSDPDIADFVQRDPSSSNLRKPFVTADAKTVPDSQSGLLCPYNAGTTTVTVSSGGLSFSRKITVLPGSVLPPCGTVPLSRSRFTSPAPNPKLPNQAPPPASAPPIALTLPAAPLAPNPPARPVARPPVVPEFVAPPQPQIPPRVIPPPPPPSLARPIPPTGGMSRVMEEKREEEAATEDSQAFARHYASQPPPVTWTLAGAALIAALGLATFSGRRGRPRTAQPAIARAYKQPQIAPTRRRLR